ncbi:hypothetical protein DWB77_01837 [Streptomyces hundungensis]|uniref:SCO6045-like C-terminal domain-containing protein n=1 Tax=Streptomyces hundungensis TaxID=1077946 RepID=A0A387H8S2_9ACTN|nr:DUF692 domain-containing protein [Streptomyces hundungensis]AYG79719.1 hypothetical protein DWB77_01837 [Streptomyces hundungensis]
MKQLGIGIGWRPEIASAVEGLDGIDWVEAVAENLCPGHLPDSLVRLRERGVTVVPHGVSLGLGGADRPDARRLAELAARAEALGSPLVTEHIAFVRAGGTLTASPRLEAGHLLPVPRTRDALRVLCENVRIAQDALPVPLALENIAALIDWPYEELTEGQFLTELVERTGVGLLVDVANLHTNRVNRGEDPVKVLDALPLEAIAYVHVAGGVERDGVWHDTHAHPVPRAVLDVLAELAARMDPPGVLLERDEAFPPAAELAGELDAIRSTLRPARRPAPRPAEPVAEPVAGPVSGAGPEAPAEPAARTSAAIRTDATAPEGSRERLALAQAALLSSLTAGTPAPAGFDGPRLRVQARALAAKRADVVAKVAPELVTLLGDGFREAFLGYAKCRPMSGGYRQDALDFARSLLDAGRPGDADTRRALARWWKERAGARPPGRAARLLNTVGGAALGRRNRSTYRVGKGVETNSSLT